MRPPPIFGVFNSPSPDPRGRWTQQGEGARRQTLSLHKSGLDVCTHCWDMARKPPKCKNSPLTPIVTKISFAPFSARRGPPTPKRGEVTSRSRLRPHANFGVNSIERRHFQLPRKNPTPVLRSRHSLTLNISEYRHDFNGILTALHIPYSTVSFRLILSDLAKYSMTRSVARSLCISWASCLASSLLLSRKTRSSDSESAPGNLSPLVVRASSYWQKTKHRISNGVGSSSSSIGTTVSGRKDGRRNKLSSNTSQPVLPDNGRKKHVPLFVETLRQPTRLTVDVSTVSHCSLSHRS